MNINDELQMKGWFLSTEGLDICKKGLPRISAANIIEKALDTDLREIGAPYLSEEIAKGKADTVSGPCVLQIQKLKNVAAPKYETSNYNSVLLRLLLTDGHVYVNCLQWSSWKSLTLDTPPGSKLLIKSGKVQVQNGFLLLNENQFSLLGGQVPQMIEKWELSKQFDLHQRRDQSSDEGPPPWIPFGKAIDYKTNKPPTGNFRSLEIGVKKDDKEDAVFTQQRMANIAEISRSKEGKKKVFGGGKDLTATENFSDSAINSYAQDKKHSANNRDFHRKSNQRDDEFVHSKSFGNFTQNVPYRSKPLEKEQPSGIADFRQGKGHRRDNVNFSYSASDNYCYNNSRNAAQYAETNESVSNAKFGNTRNVPQETSFYRNPSSDFSHEESRYNMLFPIEYPVQTEMLRENWHNRPVENFINFGNNAPSNSFVPKFSSVPERSHYSKPSGNFQSESKFRQNSFHHSSSNQRKNKMDEPVFLREPPPDTFDESHFPILESNVGANRGGHFSGVLEFRRGGSRPFVHRNDENYQDTMNSRTPRQGNRPSARLYQPPRQR